MKLNGLFIDPDIFKINTADGDGVTVIYTLTNTPIGVGALWVYVDGIKRTWTQDYTISGKDVTFVTAPALGQKIEFNYIKKD